MTQQCHGHVFHELHGHGAVHKDRRAHIGVHAHTKDEGGALVAEPTSVEAQALEVGGGEVSGPSTQSWRASWGESNSSTQLKVSKHSGPPFSHTSTPSSAWNRCSQAWSNKGNCYEFGCSAKDVWACIPNCHERTKLRQIKKRRR